MEPRSTNESARTHAPATVSSRQHNALKIVRFAAVHAAHKNLTQVAASLAFTTVLAIVPLLAIVLSLFTAFPLFSEFRSALEDFLAASLMPPAVSANVMEYLNQFAAKASGLTAIGSLALIFTSIMLLLTIDEAFNSIWQVQRQRPLRRRILVYWAIISLGPILTGASLWASSTMAQYSISYVEGLPFGLGFALMIAPLVTSTLGFTALFMVVPNCRVRWRDAAAGGFATALVLSLMRTGFAYYLARFPSYAIIYGAFAILPIFLLWIYMSWLAILSGATMAATLPAIRQRQWDTADHAGAALVNAITVLRCLWTPAPSGEPGRTTAELSEQTSLAQHELRQALGRLQELGYVVSSEQDERETWVFAVDPRTAQLAPLVRALLIDDAQPQLRSHPELAVAVAKVMLQHPVLLETLLERPQALSEIGHIGQNDSTASINAETQETHHAQSQ